MSYLSNRNDGRRADSLRDQVAIVTGGASGIGAALVRALVAGGAVVVIADTDEAGAQAVADQLSAPAAGGATAPGSPAARGASPGLVRTAALDVRDADGVADLVQQTAAEHGRLDLIFNNAGIAVGGLVEELTLDHWNRVIDVNLRGVVHGVHPLMLSQGHGHIVNTASLAGLVPGPMLAPYAAAKHAVVGLSLALRAEAAARGVRVSVVCPGFVDTPLLSHVNPDLPQTETGSTAVALARLTGRLYDAESLAGDVLRGVARNEAVIVAPARARLAWRMTRYASRLSMRMLTAAIRRG
jgi:NAD(P)-dependent dehydrogenase (short-subunit alcohol dehydrogenase family)